MAVSAVILEPPARSAGFTPPKVAAAPQGALKKVSFGIAAKKETKTVYPVFPDEHGQAAEIGARIIERTAQFEALKGALETDKAELKFIVSPHYFAVNHGRHEVPSSIAINIPEQRDAQQVLVRAAAEVLVTYQNRYSPLPDEAGLLPILGDRVGEFFRQSFEVKIKGDSIPDDKAQDLMNELQTLFAKFNCTDALELKEGIKPNTDFHAARHVSLTVEQNVALEQTCPIMAMVKTKGRK